MRRRLGWLWRSPLTWGVLYVALVPVFATLYSSLPARSFHDANIKIEASLATDAAGVLDALTASVDARLTSTTWAGPAGRLRVAPDGVRVARIRHMDDGRLLIELSGVFASVGRQEPRSFGGFKEWVQVFVAERLVTQEPGHPAQVGYGVSVVSPDGGSPVRLPINPPVSVLLPPLTGSPPPASDGGVLMLSLGANHRLVRFYRAAQGDPSFASGLWLRMLYFSSTTITTLGLGDLTPVSAAARGMVGLEALTGIIVIGLFLNALAGGFRTRRREQSSQRDERS